MPIFSSVIGNWGLRCSRVLQRQRLLGLDAVGLKWSRLRHRHLGAMAGPWRTRRNDDCVAILAKPVQTASREQNLLTLTDLAALDVDGKHREHLTRSIAFVIRFLFVFYIAAQFQGRHCLLRRLRASQHRGHIDRRVDCNDLHMVGWLLGG